MCDPDPTSGLSKERDRVVPTERYGIAGLIACAGQRCLSLVLGTGTLSLWGSQGGREGGGPVHSSLCLLPCVMHWALYGYVWGAGPQFPALPPRQPGVCF